ncbi:MAG: hypothetical protein IJL63_02035 [Clostridia bacterium]|nr:hypothetical protein [Clostridia bacterium]
MADIIKINTDSMKQYAARLAQVNARVVRLNFRIKALYGRVGLIGLYNLIRADQLIHFNWNIELARNYLVQTANEFNTVEAGLSGQLSIWSRFLDESIKIAVLGASVPILPAYGKYVSKDKFNDEIEKRRKAKGKSALPEQKKHDIKQKNKDSKFYKKKGTILEADAEKDLFDKSVLEKKAEGDSKYAEGSAELKLVTAGVTAGASAGLYTYEQDKDGKKKKIFSPGVNAEVGASVSVLAAAADGRIGLGKDKKDLGVYGSAEADVLTAEAKAKLAVNRKQAMVDLGAEADVAKISGTAGVSVLGADVGVSGSLKFGVGVHAKAGYVDGHIKVDIGAAVGLGADVGLDIDVGGAVKAVAGVAKSAWDGLISLF